MQFCSDMTAAEHGGAVRPSVTATLAVLLLVVCDLPDGGSAAAQSSAGSEDIVAYCRIHRTEDFPNRNFLGQRYKDGLLPKQVAAIQDATDWRCEDGRVLLCADTMDHQLCSKKIGNYEFAALLKPECAASPNAPNIPMATEWNSSSTWRCKGTTPVIIESYPTDKRSFFKDVWVEYVVRNGAVIAPVTMPDGPALKWEWTGPN
jgi:hypothetical protein